MLSHLENGWQVDQAILSEEDKVVIIRFGHDWDPTCMKMDETLFGIAEKVKNFAVTYLVDITKVPDFNKMYELYDPCTCMFFFRNKHIMIDLGTGNNNKINWAIEDKGEMIAIVETVFRGARKGRGLVVSPKDYSTKYRYWNKPAFYTPNVFLLSKYCWDVLYFIFVRKIWHLFWICRAFPLINFSKQVREKKFVKSQDHKKKSWKIQ